VNTVSMISSRWVSRMRVEVASFGDMAVVGVPAQQVDPPVTHHAGAGVVCAQLDAHSLWRSTHCHQMTTQATQAQKTPQPTWVLTQIIWRSNDSLAGTPTALSGRGLDRRHGTGSGGTGSGSAGERTTTPVTHVTLPGCIACCEWSGTRLPRGRPSGRRRRVGWPCRVGRCATGGPSTDNCDSRGVAAPGTCVLAPLYSSYDIGFRVCAR
jgi:hypothetical protein